MKKTIFAIALGLLAASAFADPPSDVMRIVREAEPQFVQSKLVPGIAQARIHGDPSVPGEMYIVRNRFSPGTFSPPHFHPGTRYIQVLKGTWWVGAGPKWDKDATTPVPAGGFVVHHPNKIHYDGAKDEEVIVQIWGIGPATTTRVDESGQPKK